MGQRARGHGREAALTVGPRDVLGVPVLPPPRVASLGNRARAAFAGLHRAMAPPPVRIMEGVLGGLDLAALAALCRLGIPDRLTGPRASAELAAELGVDSDRLRRLLAYAATRGWVRVDRQHRFRPTRVTRFLRIDHPGGWRAWVEFAAGAEISGALGVLDRALTSDGDAFATANGSPFFAWMATNPERHRSFDAAMAAGGRLHGLLLARALEWSSSRRVCDIGGGDGALLGVLLAEHPHLQGVVLELPEVAARVPAGERLTAVGGDAFRAVPVGCDTYLLVNVLHDWDDQAAAALLRRAAEALSGDPLGTEARVVVLEGEAHERPRDDLATRADLLMLALTPGGRERTAEEFAALGAAAGLRLHRSVPLVSGDLAHVFGPADGPRGEQVARRGGSIPTAGGRRDRER